MAKLTKAQTAMLNAAKRQLTDFEKAVREHEMRGGGDPADIPAIEANYKYHKQAMRNILNALYSWQPLTTPGAIKR